MDGRPADPILGGLNNAYDSHEIETRWQARWLAVACLVTIGLWTIRGDLQIAWAGVPASEETRRLAQIMVRIAILGGCAWCLRVLLRGDVHELFRATRVARATRRLQRRSATGR